jgi:hypothetical protein
MDEAVRFREHGQVSDWKRGSQRSIMRFNALVE